MKTPIYKCDSTSTNPPPPPIRVGHLFVEHFHGGHIGDPKQ